MSKKIWTRAIFCRLNVDALTRNEERNAKIEFYCTTRNYFHFFWREEVLRKGQSDMHVNYEHMCTLAGFIFI